MTDLPNTSAPTGDDNTKKTVQQPVMISTGGKEIEGGLVPASEMPLKPVGHEVVLTKEVSESGVKVAPQQIPVPPPVAQQGVQAVGANVPPHPTEGSSVTLPLTEAQMSKALHENVHESVRWLAEWCVRQIKKMHVVWNAQERISHDPTNTQT